MNKIPLVDLKAQHALLHSEIEQAISRVIQNTNFIQGKEVKDFEQAFAAFLGEGVYCSTCGNGTDALILALSALGIGKGDEVITTPHTFIATVEAICFVGAKPVFVDISDETMLLDPQLIEMAITPKTKAILPVHLYGQPCDMEAIMQIARKRNLVVIEDSAQAHGASWKGKKVGTWGDASCFSFFPGKNLGAYGDAGCVTSCNEEIAQKAKMLANHGRVDKYEHLIPGVNSRLDTIQAAVLNVKLKHLDEWTRNRQRLAKRYMDAFQGSEAKVQTIAEEATSVWHLFVLRHPEREQILRALKEKEIYGGIHYPIALHLQPALSYLGYEKGSFPIAEKAADEVFSLPLYPELSFEQQDKIIDAVQEFLSQLV